VAGRQCKELKEGWPSVLPLKRRGSRLEVWGSGDFSLAGLRLAVCGAVQKMAHCEAGLEHVLGREQSATNYVAIIG
jgi:hypothetical protein